MKTLLKIESPPNSHFYNLNQDLAQMAKTYTENENPPDGHS